MIENILDSINQFSLHIAPPPPMELLPNKPIHDSSLVYDNIFNFQGCVLKFSNNCKISKVSVEAEIMTEQLYCRIAEQRNL